MSDELITQARRDAEAFARLPKAEQDNLNLNLNRELAAMTTPPRLPYWKWMLT